eukprot:TRINITY_DN3541_c0_g1_i3.p1 TRINITY_DN3541_c0_g1~~TRINITY_DN3541_c0_g1_i3.p1  ORF type:complete len:1161 (+),score=188.62 TRINITY_DN3541_c0_g1_i3:46-3528(+)
MRRHGAHTKPQRSAAAWSSRTENMRGSEIDIYLSVKQNEYSTPNWERLLSIAVKENDIAGASSYLECVSDVNIVNEETGETILHMAVRMNYKDMVTLLLNHHTNPNAVNPSNETPLHYAARYNQDGCIVTKLIEAGAEVNAVDLSQYTPMDVAFRSKNLIARGILLEHGGSGYYSNPSNRRAYLRHELGISVKTVTEHKVSKEEATDGSSSVPLSSRSLVNNSASLSLDSMISPHYSESDAGIELQVISHDNVAVDLTTESNIDLELSKFAADSLSSIWDQLSENCNITTLRIRGWSPSVDEFALFVHLLSEKPQLNTLLLISVALTPEHCRILARWIASDPYLQSLTLENNQIQGAGFSLLWKALYNNTNLKSLSLDRNPISDEGLFQALKLDQVAVHLKELRLVATMLTSCSALKLALLISQCPVCERLDITDNVMTDNGMHVLIGKLTDCKSKLSSILYSRAFICDDETIKLIQRFCAKNQRHWEKERPASAAPKQLRSSFIARNANYQNKYIYIYKLLGSKSDVPVRILVPSRFDELLVSAQTKLGFPSIVKALFTFKGIRVRDVASLENIENVIASTVENPPLITCYHLEEMCRKSSNSSNPELPDLQYIEEQKRRLELNKKLRVRTGKDMNSEVATITVELQTGVSETTKTIQVPELDKMDKEGRFYEKLDLMWRSVWERIYDAFDYKYRDLRLHTEDGHVISDILDLEKNMFLVARPTGPGIQEPQSPRKFIEPNTSPIQMGRTQWITIKIFPNPSCKGNYTPASVKVLLIPYIQREKKKAHNSDEDESEEKNQDGVDQDENNEDEQDSGDDSEDDSEDEDGKGNEHIMDKERLRESKIRKLAQKLHKENLIRLRIAFGMAPKAKVFLFTQKGEKVRDCSYLEERQVYCIAKDEQALIEQEKSKAKARKRLIKRTISILVKPFKPPKGIVKKDAKGKQTVDYLYLNEAVVVLQSSWEDTLALCAHKLRCPFPVNRLFLSKTVEILVKWIVQDGARIPEIKLLEAGFEFLNVKQLKEMERRYYILATQHYKIQHPKLLELIATDGSEYQSKVDIPVPKPKYITCVTFRMDGNFSPQVIIALFDNSRKQVVISFSLILHRFQTCCSVIPFPCAFFPTQNSARTSSLGRHEKDATDGSATCRSHKSIHSNDNFDRF